LADADADADAGEAAVLEGFGFSGSPRLLQPHTSNENPKNQPTSRIFMAFGVLVPTYPALLPSSYW
jgi:hypothetical protein